MVDDDAAARCPTLVAVTDRLTALVAELAACPATDLVEPEVSRVHAALRRAQDTVGVVAAHVLARVEADGSWATSRSGRGARDFEDWLAKESNGSRAGARRQARMARAVQEEAVPGLAAAVAGGEVTLEHADVLSRLGPTTQARREALTSPDTSCNAEFLLAQARRLGVDEFVNEVKRWAAQVDPTADERGHRRAGEKVSCTISRRDDGVAVSAFLTAVDGAALDAALTSVAGTPPEGDTRSHTQRMGTALADMARIVLDHALAAGRTGGFRPHLSVHVGYDTLVAQVNAVSETARSSAAAADGSEMSTIPAGWDPAVLTDGTPIPACVLARLACDAEVTRVVFGPRSEVLDVGRAERLYTGALRRAVVARDRHCAYPGCDRPPKYGEIHHVKHWAAHGGETSADNGILLCWHHHDVAHSRYLIIERDRGRGTWIFCERDGTLLSVEDPGRPATAGSSAGAAGQSDAHALFGLTSAES